jgi:hypothetical protein
MAMCFTKPPKLFVRASDEILWFLGTVQGAMPLRGNLWVRRCQVIEAEQNQPPRTNRAALSA